jgi:hypothetical protein
MKKLSMLFVALTVGVGAWAQQQQPTSATTTKVNTDLSKYKTFAWAKSDPTAVGPNGYDIWFYEVTPTAPGQDRDRSNDMNRDRSGDVNRDRSSDINKEPSSDINRDRSSDVNKDRTTDVNRDRSTDANRDRSTDANQSSDINRDRSTDANKDRESNSYRKPGETDQSRRSDAYGNNPSDKPSDTYNKSDAYGNKPSGYIYSYNVIIPSSIDQTNTTIKEGVENELIGRGYRENESSPDLLVVYQVFDQKATLHGYEPGTPTGTMGGQVYQPSDTTSFVLEPGTLMVSLIDAKTSQMVWNGFSSGLVNNSAFTTEDADLKEAIHTIFEKFQNQADKAKRD